MYMIDTRYPGFSFANTSAYTLIEHTTAVIRPTHCTFPPKAI